MNLLRIRLSLFGAVGAAGLIVSAVQAAPILNEFVANHDGVDSHEFIEIFGDPSTDYSSLRIIEIEGDGSPSGTIDRVFTPGTTNAGGFWTTPFQSTIENGTITLLLVSDFSGAVGNDVDTNNDGTFDVTPWTSILDSIAVTDGTAGDLTYGVTLVPSFDGGAFTVGGASRIPNGTDTDSASDWVRNDFDRAGIPTFTGTPVPGEAYNTPDAINSAVPEPTTLGLLAFGALGMIRRRRAD